jgi:hypothetical protein
MSPTRNRLRRTGLLGAGVAMAAMLTLGGCDSGGGKHSAASSSATPTPAATRWWSNAAAQVGSTIDPARPSAAAASLTTSRSDYCAMLSQTKDKGKGLIPADATKDPRLVTQTEALVAEIQAVAPANVTAAWKVVAPVILQVARSGSLPTSGSSTANLQAAETINDDAKANCHLDLSSLITGG